MELEVLQLLLPITHRVNRQFGNISLAKVKRTEAGMVEDSVHGHKGSSRGDGRGKEAVGRETAVQAPGDEQWLVEGMKMRQTATVDGQHENEWGGNGQFSKKKEGRLPIGPQVFNLPHNSQDVP
jgi:hypothetical protein